MGAPPNLVAYSREHASRLVHYESPREPLGKMRQARDYFFHGRQLAQVIQGCQITIVTGLIIGTPRADVKNEIPADRATSSIL